MHKNIHFVDKPGQATRKYRAGASQALQFWLQSVLQFWLQPARPSSPLWPRVEGKHPLLSLELAGWLAGFILMLPPAVRSTLHLSPRVGGERRLKTEAIKDWLHYLVHPLTV